VRRHGDIPDSSPADPAAKSGQPTTGMVNGTFGLAPRVRLVFDEQPPELPGSCEISVDL
jgi:hypothetical protein